MVWLSSFCKTASLVFIIGQSAMAGPLVDPSPIEFKKEKIRLAGKEVNVELAGNEAERSHGLMFREKLSDHDGMLFVFENEQSLSFWMKNTFLDLSIGYFNKNRTLVDVQEMRAMNSVMTEELPSYTSAKPAMYALEMTKGWFTKNKIKPGAKFEFAETPRSRSKSKAP